MQQDPSVFDLTLNNRVAHPIARKHLSEFSSKSLEVLENDDRFLNPDSEFINPLLVTDAANVESGVSERNRNGLIYGLFEIFTPTIDMDVEVQFEDDEWYYGTISNVVESNGVYSITVVFDDGDILDAVVTYPEGNYVRLILDSSLVKVGMTNNATDRQINYRNDPNYPNYGTAFKMIGLIQFDRIKFETDQKLAAIKLEFVNAVINDPDISPPMKQMYESLLTLGENANGREWHRIGVGRQFGMQMLEVGVQTRMNIPDRPLAIPAEGFMWNDTKHDYMVATAIDAVDEMIPFIDRVIALPNQSVRISYIR